MACFPLERGWGSQATSSHQSNSVRTECRRNLSYELRKHRQTPCCLRWRLCKARGFLPTHAVTGPQVLLLRQSHCSLFKSPDGPRHVGYKHHQAVLRHELCFSRTLGLLHPVFPWQQPGSFNTTHRCVLVQAQHGWKLAGDRHRRTEELTGRQRAGLTKQEKGKEEVLGPLWSHYLSTAHCWGPATHVPGPQHSLQLDAPPQGPAIQMLSVPCRWWLGYTVSFVPR